MTKKIKLKMSSRLLKKRSRRGTFSPKNCRFSTNPDLALHIDYKNPSFLRNFLSERGKITPIRISGNSSIFQRKIACEVKKARIMGLLPYGSLDY